MKLKTWCQRLQHHPLWAIVKAVDWNVGGKEEVLLDAFQADVRLAEKSWERERMKLLEQLLSEAGESPERQQQLEREANDKSND